MSRVFGFECKIWRESDTPGTFVELEAIRNATLSLGYAEAEATTRGSGGVEEVEPSLLQVSIDGQFQWQNGDADCEALWDAFFGRTPITLRVLTGAANDPDARGVTGDFKITKFPQKQDLDKLVEHDITLKPCGGSGLVPYEGTGS